MEPTHFWREVGIGLIPNGIAALAGFLLAYFVRDRLFNPYRFGGWRVRVLRGDKELTARDIGWRKAQAIADDVSELSVFLKGVVSPYAWVTCDIVAEGQAVGLLRIDPKPKGLFFKTRTYTIDVAKNPLPDKSRFQGWRVRLLRAGANGSTGPCRPAAWRVSWAIPTRWLPLPATWLPLSRLSAVIWWMRGSASACWPSMPRGEPSPSTWTRTRPRRKPHDCT